MSEVGAYQKERLQKLAEKPNTSVLEVNHDSTHEPWKAERLRGAVEDIAERASAFPDDVVDFTVRKTLLDDPETLAFKKDHPKLYWMLTDRKMLKDARFRQALGGMLKLREQVEAGVVAEGNEADALATQSVVAALQQT